MEENSIKEKIAIKGGIMKLKNLTLLFNPNLTFLGLLLGKKVLCRSWYFSQNCLADPDFVQKSDFFAKN